MSDSALDTALACAAAGWRVFPIRAGAKTPLTPNGFKDATTDTAVITAWGAQHPGCNWAVACGPSDLLVVDGDPRNGADLADVASKLPQTLAVQTGGGGMHWYFRGARCVPKSIGPGIDLKSAGGYVLLPGSVTTGPYTWADMAPIADVPQAVLDAIAQSPSPRPPSEDDAPEGLTLSPEWAELAKVDLAALPAAKRGDGGTPLLRAAAVAIRGWLLDLDTADAVLRAVWCPRCEPPWLFDDAGDERNWWHTIERARDIGDVEWGSRVPLVGLDAAPSVAAWRAAQSVAVQREDSSDPLPANSAAPTVDASGLQLAPGGWPWILRQGTACWLHELNRQAYGDEFPKTDLRLEIKRTHGRIIPITYITAKGARAELTPAEIESGWEQRVADVRSSYLERVNRFDTVTRTLTLAALKWAALPARMHADVDEWLRALGGAQYDRLAQWLASCVALDRPAPALYIYGELQTGKSLLARGVARLWQTEPGPFKEALADFNEAAATCPLMYADEGFPEKMSFNDFREMVTSPTRRVNKKYKAKYPVMGCVRIILSTNNAQALRYQKTGALTKDDAEAIANRLLVVYAGAAARVVLQRHKAASFVDENKIAEHALWLAQTVPLEPQHERMCVDAGGPSLPIVDADADEDTTEAPELDGRGLLGAIQRGRFATILRTLMMPAASALDGVAAEGTTLLVNVRLLHKAVQKVSLFSNGATEADVRDMCQSFALGPRVKRRLPHGAEPLWWWPLDGARVLAEVAKLD